METDVLTHKLFSKFTAGNLPNFPIYEISRPFSVCDVRKNPALLPHLTSFNQSNNSEKRRIIFSNFGILKWAHNFIGYDTHLFFLFLCSLKHNVSWTGSMDVILFLILTLSKNCSNLT